MNGGYIPPQFELGPGRGHTYKLKTVYPNKEAADAAGKAFLAGLPAAQGGTGTPSPAPVVPVSPMLPNSASPVAQSTEPGSVRITPVGSQGQPQSFPAGAAPLGRSGQAAGLMTNPQTKTSSNVQAILRRLLAPKGMLPNYSN